MYMYKSNLNLLICMVGEGEVKQGGWNLEVLGPLGPQKGFKIGFMGFS